MGFKNLKKNNAAAAECVEPKTFGEPAEERRYIQIPRESYKKYLSYSEWRDFYARMMNRYEWNLPPEKRTPDPVKERAIQIIWEEGLSASEYEAKLNNTTRPFSPEVKKVIDYNIYLANNFDKVWNEIEEEWQKRKEKIDLQAAVVANEQEKTQPRQRYEVDWSQLDGLPEENYF